jgi:hypothetical protein
MGNPMKGEVTFDADGKQYTLRFSTNAMITIESEGGRTFPALVEELRNPETLSIKTVRLLFWGGLQDHHPALSITDAGTVMDHVGGLLKSVELIASAANQMVDPESKDTRPRKPARQQQIGPAH